MANYTGDAFKYMLATKQIDFSTDTFKARLMTTGYTFDRSTHTGWSDVSASELANGNGYTTGGVTLSGVTVTTNTTLHKVTIAWSNPSWTASGGTIGPSAGMMVIDDTPTGDPIFLYVPFSPEQSQEDGGAFTITNVSHVICDTDEVI